MSVVHAYNNNPDMASSAGLCGAQGWRGPVRDVTCQDCLDKLLDQLAEPKKIKCDCPNPDNYHYRGCSVLVASFYAYTADGQLIRDGMAVWDYDLKPGYVALSKLADDGWFEVVRAKGDARGSAMNAERVCVRHPFTGQSASDALRERGVSE